MGHTCQERKKKSQSQCWNHNDEGRPCRDRVALLFIKLLTSNDRSFGRSFGWVVVQLGWFAGWLLVDVNCCWGLLILRYILKQYSSTYIHMYRHTYLTGYTFKWFFFSKYYDRSIVFCKEKNFFCFKLCWVIYI